MKHCVLSISSWPRAILHIDGDAFFTSCEEAIHPELRGKPLITGGERGIVACASYAAKALGVKRGVPLHEARRICRDLTILPSDYETYSLFSRRMFSIIRRFTPQVEEYSIDEAFADLTGMRRVLHSSYEDIALAIKQKVESSLGISVTVGLSITKVLAKIASKHKKPGGLTLIPGEKIPLYLEDLPVENIWGIGQATSNYLWKIGVKTALDFARLPETRVRKLLPKPIREIWHELRGRSLYPVSPVEKTVYASISKVKTFSPSTNDRNYIFAQLLRNCESACIKARRYSLAPHKVLIILKSDNFITNGAELRLNRPSAYPMELTAIVRELFDTLYRPATVYRSTGIVLLDLRFDENVQYSLFESPIRVEKIERLYGAADLLAGKYGKHVLHLGGSHPIDWIGQGKRGKPTIRKQTRLKGETSRKHIGLPLYHVKV